MHRCIGLLLLIVALIFTPWMGPGSLVHAAGFTVNSTTDEPDALPGDGICASTVPGRCTLRAAIMEANALPGPDMIALPIGAYVLSVVGRDEQAAATGDLDVASDITILGTDAQRTIIDAGRLDRVFEVVAGRLTISDVTIQNGFPGNAGGGGIAATSTGVGVSVKRSTITKNETGAYGGGISVGDPWTPGTRLELEDVTVSENRSTYGGGIAAFTDDVVISRSMFLGNTTMNSGGGGLYIGRVGGGTNPPSVARISESSFATNRAEGGGGGIDVGGNTLVEIVRTTLEGNQAGRGGAISNAGILSIASSILRNNVSASDGGGISLAGVFTDAALTLSDTIVTGNRTGVSGSGGGIAARFGSRDTVTVQRSTISENVSYGAGGGIKASRLEVIDSTIRDNAASYGGGIQAMGGDVKIVRTTVSRNRTLAGYGGGIDSGASEAAEENPGSLVIENSTISGNSSLGKGGGIASVTKTTIVNTTIVANHADLSGGGMFVRGPQSKTLSNSIVAWNTASAGRANCEVTITSLGHNLESSNTCGVTAVKNDVENAEPKLGPLADNGGPTQTHALLQGSPAIDRGADAICSATDQRGAPRPRDGNGDGNVSCDIGSFEATAQDTPQPAVCTPRPPITVRTVATGDGRLRATISVSGTNNTLQTLRFTRTENSEVDVAGQGWQAAPISVGLPSVTTGTNIMVRRLVAGRTATVHVIVVDRCGEWPTFFGGGPGAF